ncbi:MAG: hypothetical protein A2015_13685 [Spirochaetes bacterium GWF1_31_7]|nr:MAG: hypothetical protein A2Y30_11140 [Spirochaetes bacterium GWE1_32_154]OHD47711.1 MAG: hypothetical protein A2Y29_05110 [Spirochaetes bacterium GWE2_31_10]OHD49870.1 MAG: hypothetical protein A2015_13685 [Spirochaetes bacterium GWF1_31_7]OHD82158.1 MAG: hypothetical protein A2355_13765 [Spirochaetes bacterium RIFOXYB1_FULL_32_8]HBD92881.1 50S ribosomal protein L25 [Spirochaetia bacterium]
MSEFVLEATKRELLKKEASKRYRRDGFIPSIIYGQGKNTNILITSRSFMKMYPKLTKSTVITLVYEGKSYETLIKDYDKNYLRNEFIHIDFFELKKGQNTHVTIPLTLIGSPIGVKKGGVLDTHLSKIEVECKPADIVTHLDIDISKLDLNQNIHVKDLNLDKKYKILTHLDEVIVSISGTTTEAPVATTEA